MIRGAYRVGSLQREEAIIFKDRGFFPSTFLSSCIVPTPDNKVKISMLENSPTDGNHSSARTPALPGETEVFSPLSPRKA